MFNPQEMGERDYSSISSRNTLRSIISRDVPSGVVNAVAVALARKYDGVDQFVHCYLGSRVDGMYEEDEE